MIFNVLPLTKEKNRKKFVPIEFFMKIMWDPPVGPIASNVLRIG